MPKMNNFRSSDLWWGIKTAVSIAVIFSLGYFFGSTNNHDGDVLLSYCYPYLTSVYEQGNYPDICIPASAKQNLMYTPPAVFPGERPNGRLETPAQDPCPIGYIRTGQFECRRVQ